MKPLVFVDANIYLRFYGAKRNEFRKLLQPLGSIRECLFVPRQTVDEVERNKVSVFVDHATGLKGSVPQALELPSFDPDPKSESRRTWAARIKMAQGLLNNLASDYAMSVDELSRSIAAGTDYVSKELHPVFADAVKPTSDELQRAALRKQLGNPPGKKSDPVGDELAWEQLLSHVCNGQSVWIVSGDNDFTDKVFGRRQLNAMLYREIKARIGDGEVYVFEDLSQALRQFAESGGHIEHAPKPEDVEQIQEEEQANAAIALAAGHLPHARVWACPACKTMGIPGATFDGSGTRLVCIECGYLYPPGVER